jgi:hypothetical protein
MGQTHRAPSLFGPQEPVTVGRWKASSPSETHRAAAAPPPQWCCATSVSPIAPLLARRTLRGPLLLVSATSSHLSYRRATTGRAAAPAAVTLTALYVDATRHSHSWPGRLVDHAPSPWPTRPDMLSGPRAREAVTCGPEAGPRAKKHFPFPKFQK